MPESTETRLARLEASREDHADRLKVLAPLVAGHAVMEERYDNLRGDLNEGLKAIRDEIVEMKKDSKERAKERRTMIVALIVCGVGLFGTFVATAVPLLKGPTPAARTK